MNKELGFDIIFAFEHIKPHLQDQFAKWINVRSPEYTGGPRVEVIYNDSSSGGKLSVTVYNVPEGEDISPLGVSLYLKRSIPLLTYYFDYWFPLLPLQLLSKFRKAGRAGDSEASMLPFWTAEFNIGPAAMVSHLRLKLLSQ